MSSTAVMAALCLEAKRRGTSYGGLMAATTEGEREEIVQAWEAGGKEIKKGMSAWTEQCRGCICWRSVGAGTTDMVCNCLSDTGHRARREGGKCLSRDVSTGKRKRVCELATTEKSTLSGYKIEGRR